MQNQDVVESKQEKLPIVDDSKYKKMTETLLSNESEIHNLSYTNLVHLADYLKAYQSTLIKQNQFQAAKEISELKEKVLIQLKSQTKQLKQYNKKEKSMMYLFKNYYSY